MVALLVDVWGGSGVRLGSQEYRGCLFELFGTQGMNMRIQIALASLVAASAVSVSPVLMAKEETIIVKASYVGGQILGFSGQENKIRLDSSPENSRLFDDFRMGGVQIGHRWDEVWSVELSYVVGDTKASVARSNIDVDLPVLSGRYHFVERNYFGFEPYAGLALGVLMMDPQGSNDRNRAVIGPELGVQYRLPGNFMIDLGTRFPYNTDTDRWHGQGRLGLNWMFGVEDRVVARKGKKSKSSEDSSALPAAAAAATVAAQQQAAGDESGKQEERATAQTLCNGDVMEAKTTQFGFNSTNLDRQAREDLETVAAILKANPGTTVILEGHTCNMGSTAYNERLSKQRAEEAKRSLMQMGIPAGSISTVGVGPHRPVADNTTEAGRVRNRRVDAIIRGPVVNLP